MFKQPQKISHCCGAKVVKFGGKRRQCTECQKTWTLWPKNLGRPEKNLDGEKILEAVMCHGTTFGQYANQSVLTYDQVRYRFQKEMDNITAKPRKYPEMNNKLILLVDGVHFSFNDETYALYLMALRSTESCYALRCDPVLLPKGESCEGWREAYFQLPQIIRDRTVALVSDGFPGYFNWGRDHDWVTQRCHFHLLKEMENRLGRIRSNTSQRPLRMMIYDLIKEALREPNETQFQKLLEKINKLKKQKNCPKYLKGIANSFIRRHDHFRAYLNYPKLNLPTTTNCMESTGSRVRKICDSIKTPTSLQKWAICYVRMNPTITCNGG